MRARIYRPARPATQSGMARSAYWVLEFEPEAPRAVDPLMGWTASPDTRQQVHMRFPSREAALEYAREQGIEAVVQESPGRRHIIRPRGYGENFRADRRQGWTH